MIRERLITNLTRQGRAELALVYRENLRAKEAERISPYVLKFNRQGEPNFAYERQSELGKREFEGMRSMWRLANDNFKYVIWLSPPGGISGYTEGRMVVGKVLKKGKETEIECRGIPLLRNREEILKMANQLGGETREVEELRNRAVRVEVEDDEELWQRCEKVFGMNEVWKYIRRGQDITNKEKTEVVVTEVMEEMKVRQMGNDVRLFELMMRNRGFVIGGGNHGGTNLEMFSGVNNISAFKGLFGKSEIMIKAEKIDGKIVCPCGERLPEGTSRCPKCGLRFTDSV